MHYTIEPNEKFFHAARRISEWEGRPKTTIQMVSLVDLTEVEALRMELAEKEGIKVSYTAFVAKALAIGLREYPTANRRAFTRPFLFFLGPRLQTFKRCDVAVVAERSPDNLDYVSFMDVMRDADRLSLIEIHQWLSRLAQSDETNNKQWRQFKTLVQRLPSLVSSLIIHFPTWFPNMWVKYRGGAAMISSPGKYGGDFISGAWTHTIAASFGLVKKRAIVIDGAVCARPSFYLLLHLDRRVMAGGLGARFLSRVIAILENAREELKSFASTGK